VEVVWSALVLTIVVVAVLSGMDTAAISSGLSRARSTGATLAEQDQERLRSMRAVDLSNYTERRTVNLGGGPYAVYREPPYFLEPVATAWRIVRQNEQVPAR
jgi:hypothetical protein